MRKLESTAGLMSILVLLYASPSNAEDDYYTWIDENGVVNYSEHNPQGLDARFVSLSLIHISEPRDQRGSRMPSSA